MHPLSPYGTNVRLFDLLYKIDPSKSEIYTLQKEISNLIHIYKKSDYLILTLWDRYIKVRDLYFTKEMKN